MDKCAHLTLFSLKSPHILVSVFERARDDGSLKGVPFYRSLYLVEEDILLSLCYMDLFTLEELCFM